MSTSCKPALGSAMAAAVRPFPYAELPDPDAGNSLPAPAASSDRRAADAAETLPAIAAARQEGEAKARAVLERQLAEIRDNWRNAVERL